MKQLHAKKLRSQLLENEKRILNSLNTYYNKIEHEPKHWLLEAQKRTIRAHSFFKEIKVSFT